MNFKSYKWGYCRFCHRDVAVTKIDGIVRLNFHSKPNRNEEKCTGGGTRPTVPRKELTIDQEAALYAQWCKARVKETLKYVNPYTGQLEGAQEAQRVNVNSQAGRPQEG